MKATSLLFIEKKPSVAFWAIKQLPLICLTLGCFILNAYVANLPIVFGPLVLLFMFRMFYNFVYWRSYSYTIDNELLIFKRGVFTRREDYLELYRVKDISSVQPLLLRLFNLMHVYMDTSDHTHPTFSILGVEHDELTDQLRTLVERNRRDKNVYEID